MSRFCFLSHTVRYQSHRMPRIEIQSKLSCTSLEKENGMEELGFTEVLAVASVFLVQRGLTSG